MALLNILQIKNALSNANILNCTDPKQINVEGVATIEQATNKQLSFLWSKASLNKAKASNAGVFLVSKHLSQFFDTPIIEVDNAEISLIELLNLFYPKAQTISQISAKASIDQSAIIGSNVLVKDFASVGANTTIGNNTTIETGAIIGADVIIGQDAHIGCNTVIKDRVVIGNHFFTGANCSVGTDGFRFVNNGTQNLKIPQVGTVVIGNSVEMGSNCCIDRGGLNDTIIGDGCKFDNMVHVAHNCILGKNVIIAGQSGMAGSTEIKDNVLISGHCALGDHITIAEGTILGGKTAIRTSINKKNQVYVGELGLEYKDFQKYKFNLNYLINFQGWIKRIKDLEQKVFGKSN